MLKRILFIGCCCLLATSTWANWIENIHQTVNQVQSALSDKHVTNPTASRAPKSSPAILASGEKIPFFWHERLVLEPVFNSELYFIESGIENKETIILIHGIGQSGFLDWQHVIPVLEKNYHVIALDLPGFGRSAVPSGRYSPTVYARLIYWLAKNYAKTPPIIVGHSMGGAIALRFAANYPKTLKQLVLVDAAGILERTAFLKHSASLPINLQKTPESLTGAAVKTQDFAHMLAEFSTVIPDVTALINSSNLIWNQTFAGRPLFNAAVALVNEDFSDAVKNLPVDTSIIWGEQDNVAPMRTAKILAQQLKSARLVTIAQAKHTPMLTHADAFNNLLLSELTTPITRKVATRQSPKKDTLAKNLICNQESGTRYSGTFNKIIINNCTGITLENVVAKEASISHSVVTFNQVELNTKNTALYIEYSTLQADNSKIKGLLGIYAEDSRLDLAGVKITGIKRGISIGHQSRFIFSLSELVSPFYHGSVHTAINSEHSNLDSVLQP